MAGSFNYFRGLQNWPNQLNKSIKIDTQKLNALTKALEDAAKKQEEAESVWFCSFRLPSG